MTSIARQSRYRIRRAVPSLPHDPAHFHEAVEGTESEKSIPELDLSPSAKAAAEQLFKQFPTYVKFTSGRRDIPGQARAMAPNVLKKRNWIALTYADTPQRTSLQAWVDAHPEAKDAATIASGLEGVMKSWSVDQQRNFSRHITGDAFDVAPVAANVGQQIKDAIPKLPKYL